MAVSIVALPQNHIGVQSELRLEGLTQAGGISPKGWPLKPQNGFGVAGCGYRERTTSGSRITFDAYADARGDHVPATSLTTRAWVAVRLAVSSQSA
jgi:hypothetical protein